MVEESDSPVALYYDESSERNRKAAVDIRAALDRKGVDFYYGPNNLGDGLGGMTLLVISGTRYPASLVRHLGLDELVRLAKNVDRLNRTTD